MAGLGPTGRHGPRDPRQRLPTRHLHRGLRSDPTPIGAVTGAPANGQAVVVFVDNAIAYAVVGCRESVHSVAVLDATTMTPTIVLGAPVHSSGDLLGLRVAQSGPMAVGFPTYR